MSSPPMPRPVPHLRRAGSTSILVDCGSLELALRAFKAISQARDRDEIEISELIPAAETVLVSATEYCAELHSALERILASMGPEGAKIEGKSDSSADEEIVIPVIYDGEDLDDVAGIAGVSVEEVIARHVGASYVATFLGFVPGFAYLAGNDPLLEVPRRSSPRVRVPAGSVALAGAFSGIYPRATPGGWQLVGRTSYPTWDPDREVPAALLPGHRVRFESVREQAGDISLGAAAQPTDPTLPPGSTEVFTITDPGLLTLIEDLGRPGQAYIGVGRSGAADRGALMRANELLGNAPGAAALEFVMSTPSGSKSSCISIGLFLRFSAYCRPVERCPGSCHWGRMGYGSHGR